MQVTAARISELDTLSDLWVELADGQRAFGSHLSADANRTVIRGTLARHIAFDGVLVARSEADDMGDTDTDEILGFVTFEIETGTYDQDVTRGTVSNLFVRPERRDAGVGSRLLTAAEDTLRDAGVDAISLDVMADNEHARRFYRRHGYRPHRIELEKSMQNDTHSKEDG